MFVDTELAELAQLKLFGEMKLGKKTNGAVSMGTINDWGAIC